MFCEEKKSVLFTSPIILLISLWTGYTGASLMLDKLFNRSSFYDIVCFLILVSAPHLNATRGQGARERGGGNLPSCYSLIRMGNLKFWFKFFHCRTIQNAHILNQH